MTDLKPGDTYRLKKLSPSAQPVWPPPPAGAAVVTVMACANGWVMYSMGGTHNGYEPVSDFLSAYEPAGPQDVPGVVSSQPPPGFVPPVQVPLNIKSVPLPATPLPTPPLNPSHPETVPFGNVPHPAVVKS